MPPKERAVFVFLGKTTRISETKKAKTEKSKQRKKQKKIK